MLKVRIYSSINKEKGFVVCESIDIGSNGFYVLNNVEHLEGKIDIIKVITSYPDDNVSFVIELLDIIGVETWQE